jgi:hypothetical protein
LNTLVPTGSGLQLTNAFNINDRGEILAKAAPLGFTPNDDADLGHIVLLVPCDAEEEGCSASLKSADIAPPAASLLKNSTADRSSASTASKNSEGGVRGWRRYQVPEAVPKN